MTETATWPLANWAGNVRFRAERLHRPASVPALQRLVARARRVRAIGTGHSFSPVADTNGDLISLAGLPAAVTLDARAATATVSAGLTCGEVARRLHADGYALRNLASLPHIGIAGACATGTHGSGTALGNLATAVAGLTMVTADGDLVTLRRDADRERFPGAVVALGSLGIVTSLILDVVPAYAMRQHVYEGLPLDAACQHLDAILGAAHSVSLFTDWRGPWFTQVWRKELVTGPDQEPAEPRWHGARLATGQRHPIAGLPAASTTEQLGIPGPWHERLPHFRPEATPSAGRELQSEYLLPRAVGPAALRAVCDVRHLIAPVLQVCEVRSVAADELWLSPSYPRDTPAIHFTWTDDLAAGSSAIAAAERQLAPLGARPHWGKLFCLGPDAVRPSYRRLPDFGQLMRQYDPAGKFGNEFADTYLAS